MLIFFNQLYHILKSRILPSGREIDDRLTNQQQHKDKNENGLRALSENRFA